MDFWRIFCIFLWKNALFLRFNWKQMLVIFVGCLAIFTLYVYTTNKKLITDSKTPEIKDFDDLQILFPTNEGDYLIYTPTIFPEIHKLMEEVRQRLEISGENVKTFNTSSEMLSFLEHNCPGNCFAVNFKTTPDTFSQNTKQLRFSISSNKINISPKKRYVNDEEISMTNEYDDYMRYGFLTLQHFIDKAFIKLQSNAPSYLLEIGAMPSLSLIADDSERVIMFGSLYSILFNVLLLSTFLVPLVEEKQNGLKEFLVVATPLNFLNGVTFFLLRFMLYLVFLIAVIIIAATCSALGIIPLLYMTILLILFKLSAMSYTYLLSVCFNSVFYAKVGGLLMLIVPYIFRFNRGGISSAASVFLSTKTFMDGIEIFQIFTNKHRSFKGSDLTTNITDCSYNILSIYTLLIMQCMLYSLTYNYLSCVFPGPGGLKKPFLFCLKPSYYKKRQRNEYTTAEKGSDAIIIQDLVKRFKAPTRVIQIADRLNMVIKNKQITVLLGHNGAGKTTTMNMIMGSVPKDSGKIIVCSERDVASYRHLIGFCPQHSVFMEYMTCGQHLQFFAELRGMTKKEADRFTFKLLKQLNLEDKGNAYGKTLSGGMKRRLSLGIALAGETRVVILDEPSSGLDIESRRELWDILLELRRTKAVLVTTHHMEEAEVLGDTICILSNGRLQRTGSPLELKRKVGCGYILKLCTNAHNYKEYETLEFIKQFVPNAAIVNIVPPTVHISLPYDDKPNYKTYEMMLYNLEQKSSEFGIDSISVTDTSLEDVFLKCSAEIDQVDSQPFKRQDSIRIPYEPLTASKRISFWQHFKAIFYKKYIFLCSEWAFTVIMISLPILSSLLSIIMMGSMSMSKVESALPLNLNIVKEGRIYIQNSDQQNDFGRNVEQVLQKNIKNSGLTTMSMELGESINTKLLKMQENDLSEFLQNVIGVINIGTDEVNGNLKVTTYFSANIYHSSVVLINLIDNAILQAATSEKNSIETEYAPVRRFVTDVSPTRLEYYAVIIPIGVFFYMFFYVSLPFRENETGFKSLQAVPAFRYWFSTITFDLLQHFVVCLLLYIVQILIMPKALYNQQELITITVSIFFYGLSYLPILYIFANSFRSISAISTYLLSMLVISAIVPLITSGSVQSMQYYETTILFMRLLPDFNLNHQLRVINENFVLNRRETSIIRKSSKLLKSLNEILDTNIIVWYAIGIFIIATAIFLYIIEDKNKRQELISLFNCYKCRGINPHASNNSDEETVGLVKNEKDNVEKILRDNQESDYPLLVSSLYKFYDRKAVVCDLNFAVEKKQCFGLLGVNGAGKTTTFQMITSNVTITGGSIKIDGIDLVQNEAEYRYRFGYCPQYDCLNNFMTAYQMLKYMAKLRNVKNDLIKNEVEFWLEKLDLIKYTNVEIRHYSGGTKRKLNAAMAMIGSPSLVLLDEPTTGVDPVSRRFLWKCVQEFQKRQKTVVLTSHSMDECEQLCNRLAIMADGRFKCIGYVPELKQRFGSGFTIKIKMTEDALKSLTENVKQITECVKKEFKCCDLRENHAGMLTYFVKDECIKWSKVFRSTENFMKNCAELVEDYSVNECTLEDIFLKFDTKNRTKRESSTSSEEAV